MTTLNGRASRSSQNQLAYKGNGICAHKTSVFNSYSELMLLVREVQVSDHRRLV